MDTIPKVSIILVNYNGFMDTIECLQSLRCISYTNYEIIIVDNASTDDSVNAIKRFINNKEILIESENNLGFSAGNNIGIEYAIKHGADYCLLLNNDTLVESDFLNELINGFSHDDVALTIGKILYEGRRDTIWYAGGTLSNVTAKTVHWNYNLKDTNNLEQPQEISFATGCCMCLSSRVFKRIGYMDESYFLYEEDADLCLRIRNFGLKMMYIPKAKIYHKVSASTGKMSHLSQYYLIRNKLILIKKNFHGLFKLTAYGFSLLQILYRCCKGEYEFHLFKRAFVDFLKNINGKLKQGL